MFHIMFSLPGLYVIARFLWPLPLALPIKIGLGLAILVGSQYHLFCRLSSGSVFSPEMSRSAVIGFNWAFISILLLFFLQLLIDVLHISVKLAAGITLQVPSAVSCSLGLGLLVIAAIGVRNAIVSPVVRHIEIAVRGLPEEFSGYRVLQLTDLHISRLFDQQWAQAVVRDANMIGADLIVVTGDLIDGSLQDRKLDVSPLKELRARDGIYFITGNHEFFFDHVDWLEEVQALGMTALENQHVVLRRGAGSLVLAGVTDLTASDTGFTGPDVRKAIANAPADAPIVLLDHQPKRASVAADLGISLQLSGHTHGGLAPVLDRLFALVNGGYVSGRYDVGGMQLYVSNGTALWPGFAFRLGKPPELTCVTLRRSMR
ncbi:metallophosphoesterase [Leclercia pneumoniae]|uniref:metallophosphoesterase n=1 Tax=Leclercia pneumoniae TaxID=2815358 RepID=UPI002DBAF351|nr:metallophosphoesterase [Leclercia pneumoniae]MEB7502420.1 metallophosphoesterase [Leclercia pneumoniae]